MPSKEYLALKNFFHNTMGLNRKELREIVKEVIKEMTADNYRRFSETVTFKDMIRGVMKQVTTDFYYNNRQDLASHILSELLSGRLKYEEWERAKNLEKLGGPKAEWIPGAHA